ncbi:unnamed protein product [Prorocentrum cordatum]|uniref:Uncharacterized protein n=1 Tax=Prorocentrum cordatum TaxID=2364126 RepID=A0ABN9W4R1_9DINO|nr:unnamed protein product [Polarella glacialis]
MAHCSAIPPATSFKRKKKWVGSLVARIVDGPTTLHSGQRNTSRGVLGQEAFDTLRRIEVDLSRWAALRGQQQQQCQGESRRRMPSLRNSESGGQFSLSEFKSLPCRCCLRSAPHDGRSSAHDVFFAWRTSADAVCGQKHSSWSRVPTSGGGVAWQTYLKHPSMGDFEDQAR